MDFDINNVNNIAPLVDKKRTKYPQVVEDSGVTVAGLNGITATLGKTRYVIISNNLIWVSIVVKLTGGSFTKNVSSDLMTMTVAGRNPYAYNSFPTVDENYLPWTMKTNTTSGTLYGSPLSSTGSSTTRTLTISGIMMVG